MGVVEELIRKDADVKGLVKRLDRICKFGQPDNEKGRGAYFYLEMDWIVLDLLDGVYTT